MLDTDFIYYSDEWNQEKVTEDSFNISGVDRELKDTNSSPQQKKI